MNRFSRLTTVLLIILAPTLVFAQDRITSGLSEGAKWFSTIALLGSTIGLTVTGVKYYLAKPDARQSLEGNFIGLGIILGAGAIVELLRRWMA